MRGTYSGDGERRLNGAGQAEEAADFVLDVVRRLLFNKMYFRLKRSYRSMWRGYLRVEKWHEMRPGGPWCREQDPGLLGQGENCQQHDQSLHLFKSAI